MIGLTKPVSLCLCMRLLTCLGALTLVLAGDRAIAQLMSTNRVYIANVYIVGNDRTPYEKVMAYIHSKPGSEYTYARVQDDVSRIAEAHIFKYIRVKTDPTTDGRINVYFEVQEHPNIVKEVIFKHAKHATLKDLEHLTRIQRGMPLDTTLNMIACYEIQDYLRKEGYLLANVTLEEGGRSSDERVVFNINEGERLRVRNVEFTGQNELASGERLRTQIDTSRAFLSIFGGKYIPAMVDSDVQKLEEYYRANGYLNAHVSREITLSDDLKFVDITFHIHEGNRFRVQSWSIQGNNAHFSKEELQSIPTIKTGEYYNEGTVTKDVKYLEAYEGWRGYRADVKKVITEIPGGSDLVQVQYIIEDKPPAKVGEVIIVGNNVTQDRVIRRVLGIFPGQLLQYPELKIAEANLSRLNIFETNPELGIRPTVTELETPGEFKDILVKVQEARTGSLMLGAGINSDNGLVGSIVLNERNFDLFRFPTSFADIWEGRAWRGAGQELRIEAVPGTVVQRYSVTVREPMLFDEPYSLTTSAYYRDRIFDEYTENRFGGRVNVSHNFTDWGFKEISAGLGLRIEDVGVYDIAAGAPSDYTSVYGRHFLIAPGFNIVYDNRDSFLRPTEGGKVEFAFEQVMGDFTFPIFNLEATHYWTLWQRPDGSGKHVVMLRSQVSWEGDNAPVYERFFGGGFMSIRGFEFRGVGPNVDGFMVGGHFQWLNTLEYQIPIRANDNLYFVTFIDSGTVDTDVRLNEYRVSAGFGLRITVPMMGPVPIALDFGFPICKSATDRTQVFSFWIGMYR